MQQTTSRVTRSHKKLAEREVGRALTEWAAVHDEPRRAFNVAGSEPLGGRYPADGLAVSFVVCPDFPEGISRDIPGDPTEALKPHVALFDLQLREWLAMRGWDGLRAYWNEDGAGFTLAHHFPPVFGNESAEVLECFRPITAEEIREVELATGSEYPPFSDEQWVEIKYAGINMFRVINWRPSSDLKAGNPAGTAH